MKGSAPCEGSPVRDHARDDGVVHRSMRDQSQYRPHEAYVPCMGWRKARELLWVDKEAPITCAACIGTVVTNMPMRPR